MSTAAATLAEIVSKIASQGKNPDVSFLKDNPEAQTMLLMALLSSTAQAAAANNNNNNNTAAPPAKLDTDKRKFGSFNSVATSSPSPTRDDSDTPRRVGRKPVTSEEEDSDNPKSKRKAQNRAAQRAFRERKENHVRVLEERVKELEELNSDKNSKLLLENERLKEMITRLQNENAALLGSSVSFDYPLSSIASDDIRPQKIIRSSGAASTSAAEASPVAYFDSLSSGYSTSSKSRSNTPEAQQQQQQQPLQQQQPAVSIDDILSLDNTGLPSDALLDHSELLGFNNTDPTKTDYSTQLDDILNQHRLTFATDPSQFDFFYPLEVTNNSDILNTAAIQLPPAKKTYTDEEHAEAAKRIDIAHVWDKVSEHPRFDEIDMDILCDEMKEKAVCYELNPDKEIKKALDKYYPVV